MQKRSRDEFNLKQQHYRRSLVLNYTIVLRSRSLRTQSRSSLACVIDRTINSKLSSGFVVCDYYLHVIDNDVSGQYYRIDKSSSGNSHRVHDKS